MSKYAPSILIVALCTVIVVVDSQRSPYISQFSRGFNAVARSPTGASNVAPAPPQAQSLPTTFLPMVPSVSMAASPIIATTSTQANLGIRSNVDQQSTQFPNNQNNVNVPQGRPNAIIDGRFGGHFEHNHETNDFDESVDEFDHYDY